ncbi:hypothetical protein C8J57DRAFT_1716861 [Mycena rebaudengoi]|nr:hypothetical protein C8J57DRAFT_1716861 [Mycena rebaudengoi]
MLSTTYPPLPRAITGTTTGQTEARYFSLRRAATSMFKPDKKVEGYFTSIRSVLCSSYLTLFVFIPILWVLHFTGKDQGAVVFVFSFLGIIPLAKLLAFNTDELSWMCSPKNPTRNRQSNYKRCRKQGGMKRKRIWVYPGLMTYFLLPACNAWSITVGPGGELPIQCSNFSFEISMDGIPPYELILIPGKNDKISPISHTYFTNDSNRITLPLPYKRDTTITTIARDSAGAASVAKPFVVYGGPNTDCLSPVAERPTFQFHLSTQLPTVGIPVRIEWNANETFGVPKFFGFIPAPVDSFGSYLETPTYGTYFDLELENLSDILGQRPGYEWIPSIAPDSDVVLIGSDSRGLPAGGALNTHVESGNQICLVPLSGQYELLQRIMLYVILFFVMVFRHSSFVVSLTLFGVLTLVVVAAIDAIGTTTSSSAFDLDALGAAHTLLLSAFSGMAFVVSLREHLYKRWGEREEAPSSISGRSPEAARTPPSPSSGIPGEPPVGQSDSQTIRAPGTRRILAIFFLLGVLLFASLLCTVATFEPLPGKAYSPACSPYNITTALGAVVTKPVNLTQCTAYCSNATGPFRNAGASLASPAKAITAIRSYVLITSAVCLLFIALISSWILALVFRTKDSHYGGVVSYFILILGLIGFFAIIATGETLFKAQWIPAGEPPRSVGQWAPLVITGAILAYECLRLVQERPGRLGQLIRQLVPDRFSTSGGAWIELGGLGGRGNDLGSNQPSLQTERPEPNSEDI